MTPEGIESYFRLFRGRGDALGTWTGGCRRVKVTKEHYVRHLTSMDPEDWIGVYPLLGDLCSLGCIDIDFKDRELCERLVVMAEHKKILLWTEDTVKGHHLWCFPSEPLVPAAHMRRALMATCLASGYRPDEINPKQETLGVGAIGNYIRCPYPGGDLAQERKFTHLVACAEGGWSQIPSDLFVHMDSKGRTEAAALEEVAALWSPPTKVQVAFDETAGLDAQQILKESGGPLSWTIWSKGPLDGNDRSGTLSHLAHVLILEDGMDPTAALKVLWSHDERWGRKFVDRIGGEMYLMAMIESAMGKRMD